MDHLGDPHLMGGYPPILPGVLLALALALALHAPVARRLAIGRFHAWFLVACAGTILAITLTPSRWALELGAHGPVTCDLSRVGPGSLAVYLRFDDPMLNVLMFIPLGLAIGLVEDGRRRLGLAIAAAALPFAIELTQAVVVPLGRSCQGGDLFDNVAGLAIGIALGTTLGVLARRA
jgi:hypothetical protein